MDLNISMQIKDELPIRAKLFTNEKINKQTNRHTDEQINLSHLVFSIKSQAIMINDEEVNFSMLIALTHSVLYT